MLSIALSAAALLLPFWAPQPARADLVKAREDSTVRLPGGTVPYGTPRTEASWMSLSPDTFVSTGVVSLLVLFSGKMNNTKFGAHPKDFDQVAPNTIYEAKKKGMYVEAWAMDRRSNCLDDLTGINAAVHGKDHHTAFDYYHNNKTVSAQKFDGFYSDKDPKVAFLAHVGVDQTIKDWYNLVTSEIPDQEYRTTKHYAGGHSLGGPLAAYFANYDNDGDASTTDDAGYNQAAGFIAYDSVVSPNGSSNGGGILSGLTDPIVSAGFEVAQAGFKNNVFPKSFLTALPVVINSEVTNLLAMIGALATINGEGEAPVKEIPQTLAIKTAAQFFLLQSLVNYVTFTPYAFNFRATSNASLGAILGDPFGASYKLASDFVRMGRSRKGRSLGGAYSDAAFGNLSDAIALLKGLDSSKYPLAVPTDDGGLSPGNGPLYKRLNYDQIAEDGSNVAKTNPLCKPFANASVEVTDISELARSLCEAPLDFTEHHYPTRVTTDGNFEELGASNAIKTNVHKNGYLQRPRIALVGTEGLAIGGSFGDIGDHVVLDGYKHLDVLLAARKQNLDRKELCGITSAEFISKLGAGKR